MFFLNLEEFKKDKEKSTNRNFFVEKNDRLQQNNKERGKKKRKVQVIFFFSLPKEREKNLLQTNQKNRDTSYFYYNSA